MFVQNTFISYNSETISKLTNIINGTVINSNDELSNVHYNVDDDDDAMTTGNKITTLSQRRIMSVSHRFNIYKSIVMIFENVIYAEYKFSL